MGSGIKGSNPDEESTLTDFEFSKVEKRLVALLVIIGIVSGFQSGISEVIGGFIGGVVLGLVLVFVFRAGRRLAGRAIQKVR